MTVLFDDERYFLNKWEMHKALSTEQIFCHLPETQTCSPTAIRDWIQRFRRVYVKPVGSWGGAGITVISVGNGTDMVKYTIEDTQGHRTSHADLEEVVSLMVRRYDGQPTIVQQAAPLLRYEQRPFDVRVLMQRDSGDEWTYAGMLARVGGENSIVSNVAASGGSVYPVGAILIHFQPTSRSKRRMTCSHFKQIGYAVARVLDRYHSFEEIGLDIGLDSRLEPWLIEVNTNDALGGPSHELFAQLPTDHLYRQITRRAEDRRTADAHALLGALFGPLTGA